MPSPALVELPTALVAAAVALALWLAGAQRADIEGRAGYLLGIGAAPFVGRWRAGSPESLVVLAAVGVAAVALVPFVAARLGWRPLVALAAVAQAGWTLVLAVPDGWSSLTGNLQSRYDYLAGVAQVGSPGRFLAHFTDQIGRYPTHVRGHPPGTVLLLWGLDRVGLGGPVPVLVLCLAGGALATASVLVAVRVLAGEAVARRAAPFVLLVPAAAFAANLDLLYAGVGALVICLFVLALRAGQRRAASVRLAVAAGVVLGLGLLGSYGLALLTVPVVVLAAVRRRPGALAAVAAAAAAVVSLPAAWGFWWPVGVAATRHQYWLGLGRVRPPVAFALLDLVALAAVLGPAALVGLARLRDRSLLPVVVGVGGSVALALASQLSKGEVERIWQPFVPWLVVACGPLAASIDRPGSWRRTRRLLAVQVVAALVLAGGVRSPW